MGANETANRVHAQGQFVPVVAPPFTQEILASKGIRSFVRLGAGQYLVELAQAMAFAEGFTEASLPPNFQAVVGSQLAPDGATVLISVLSLATGEPVDPPFVGLNVWSVREGEGQGPFPAAFPPVPPPLPPAVGGGAILLFGNNGISATTADRFLTPGYDDSLAMTSAVRYAIPRAGTLQGFRVSQTSGAGNGEDIIYTARVNSAPTVQTATLASTLAGTVVTAGAPIAVAANDIIDVIAEKALAIGSSPADITATMEFV